MQGIARFCHSQNILDNPNEARLRYCLCLTAMQNQKIYKNTKLKNSMLGRIVFDSILKKAFERKNPIVIGLCGTVNSGKHVLASRIAADFAKKEIKNIKASPQRDTKLKHDFTLSSKNGNLKLSITDISENPNSKEIIETIRWFDDADVVTILMDAEKEPYSQINTVLINSLMAKDIPVILAYSKIDLKKIDIKNIAVHYNRCPIVGISAQYGKNLKNYYENMLKLIG